VTFPVLLSWVMHRESIHKNGMPSVRVVFTIRLCQSPTTSLLSLTSTDKMAEQGQTLLRNLEQSEARNTADCNEWLGQLHALTKSTVGRELAASLTSADLAVIARFGFGCGCDPTSGQISALRCLNNVLVLHTPIEQMFVDACLPEKAIELLNKGPDLGELAARLLLRVSQHLKPHLANHHLTDAVNGLVVWKRLRSSSWMHPTLLISPSCRSLRPGMMLMPAASSARWTDYSRC
ncbi:hypothetical protein GGTG_04470, partial [Gaeumannomyces tritici R3-111a-1]